MISLVCTLHCREGFAGFLANWFDWQWASIIGCDTFSKPQTCEVWILLNTDYPNSITALYRSAVVYNCWAGLLNISGIRQPSLFHHMQSDLHSLFEGQISKKLARVQDCYTNSLTVGSYYMYIYPFSETNNSICYWIAVCINKKTIYYFFNDYYVIYKHVYNLLLD